MVMKSESGSRSLDDFWPVTVIKTESLPVEAVSQQWEAVFFRLQMPCFQWFVNLLNWVSNFFLARIGTLWNRLNIENNIMKYSDIINDYNLWMEYVDQAGLDSEEDFNNMTFAEKLDIIKASFGLEANA